MLKFYTRMLKHVMINNKRVLVEFVSTGGSNPNIKGTFTTANPEIIEALEASDDFNREYEVKSVENVPGTVKETVQFRSNPIDVKKYREELEKEEFLAEDEIAAKRANKEPEAPKPIEVKIEKEKVEEVVDQKDQGIKFVPTSEVSGFQQAKSYLKNNYPELTAKQLLNKAAVINSATELGIKFEAIQP